MKGYVIKAIRIDAGLTQKEMAEQLGISAAHLCLIERGHRNVTDRIRIKVAQIFGTDDSLVEVIKRAQQSDKLFA